MSKIEIIFREVGSNHSETVIIDTYFANHDFLLGHLKADVKLFLGIKANKEDKFELTRSKDMERDSISPIERYKITKELDL